MFYICLVVAGLKISKPAMSGNPLESVYLMLISLNEEN